MPIANPSTASVHGKMLSGLSVLKKKLVLSVIRQIDHNPAVLELPLLVRPLGRRVLLSIALETSRRARVTHALLGELTLVILELRLLVRPFGRSVLLGFALKTSRGVRVTHSLLGELARQTLEEVPTC
jgi:hypothetical protein